MLLRTYGFLAAVVATYIVAVIGYSQINLLNLVDMGIAVDFAMRVQTLQHDLVGMLDLFLPIVIVALLLAFLTGRADYSPSAASAHRRLCVGRHHGYLCRDCEPWVDDGY